MSKEKLTEKEVEALLDVLNILFNTPTQMQTAITTDQILTIDALYKEFLESRECKEALFSFAEKKLKKQLK